MKKSEIINNYSVWHPIATFVSIPVASHELLWYVLISLSKKYVSIFSTYHCWDLVLEVVKK